MNPNLTPSDIFVFVGAGVSISYPAELPDFNSLRNALLGAMNFSQYVPTGKSGTETAEQRRVRDIQPEPFFHALEKAGIDIQGWLAKVLAPKDAKPNIAHRVLAELCVSGAHVWTVNFDGFIEMSDVRVKVVAAPNDFPTCPGVKGELLKPHGTLGGRLIVTPEETLNEPPSEWRERLLDDLARSKHAVFVGYSGRDFDFRTLWDDALNNQMVWWFTKSGDRSFERNLLRNVHAQGRLNFPPAHQHTTLTGQMFENPSWDFVSWCASRGLISNRLAADRDELLVGRTMTALSLPVTNPPKATLLARSEVASLLGDFAQQRKLLVWATLDPSQSARARARLTSLFLGMPSWSARKVTSLFSILPPLNGRLSGVKKLLRNKHLTQLSNNGEFDRVLEIVDRKHPLLDKSMVGLRLGALKMSGDIDAAIDDARALVLSSTNSSNNAVRCSLAFQWCHALLWAGDLDTLKFALGEHLRPLAQMTNTRWMAWADFIEACLLIACESDTSAEAEKLIENASERFAAEGNDFGIIDVLTIRLTFLRQHGRIAEYVATARQIEQFSRGKPLKIFTFEAIAIEISQMYGYHLGGVGMAQDMLSNLIESRNPVHSVSAAVLSAQFDSDDLTGDPGLTKAIRAARSHGFMGMARFAEGLLRLPAIERSSIELFFP